MKRQRAEQITREIIKQFIELRKQKGLSHYVLATRAGISRSAVSHIENGKRKPSLMLSLRIAEALDVDLSELISKAERAASV